MRIFSFLTDGVVVNRGAVLPDFSVNSLVFTLKELVFTIPLDVGKLNNGASDKDSNIHSSFSGARLHIKNLLFSESPSLKLRMLNLEKDPACFCLWEGQTIDASQKKWTTKASQLSLSLETSSDLSRLQNSLDWGSGLWRSVELEDVCIEVAMATADGSPLTDVPPPGGIVRVGVACQQYLSNASVEQLFFILDLYAYFGRVSEKIAIVGKNNKLKRSNNDSLGGRLIDKVPGDTAVSLAVKDLQLKFLESSEMNVHEMPLVQFLGDNLFVRVTHRTLGGAVAVSSTLRWESVQVDCVDTEGKLAHQNGAVSSIIEDGPLICGNGYPQLRAVFWVQKKNCSSGNAFAVPFLDISIVHVIPLDEQDIECHSLNASACISGVRLGGGMNYTEALLHRFGILGPDGGPGKELSKGLDNLRAGPLSKLFKTTPLIADNLEEGMDHNILHNIP